MKVLSKLVAANLVLSSLAWAGSLDLQKINLNNGTTLSVNNQVQVINSSFDGNLDSIELNDGRIFYGDEILSGEVLSSKSKHPLLFTPRMISSMASGRVMPGGDGSGGG